MRTREAQTRIGLHILLPWVGTHRAGEGGQQLASHQVKGAFQCALCHVRDFWATSCAPTPSPLPTLLQKAGHTLPWSSDGQ